MARAPALAADFRLLETFWREPVERTVLPNGLTLLLKPVPEVAIASVQVWVKTGSIHEDRHLGAGLSHYLEHMLFKGTSRRAGREIAATVQAHGGYINAYTTFDRTVYYIDLPAEHVNVALDVLADAVLHSTLPADEVARERDVILREIDMGKDDPDQRLGETLFETAFRQHPYRYPIIGYRDVFAARSREDLLAYYRARYVPNNLVVVVAGGVDVEATRAAVATHFGSVARAPLAPVTIPAEPPPLAARADHRFEDVEITRAGLAWQIPGFDHPDAPALDLLAVLLGQGDSSVLWQEVREKAGLVHAIDATCWNPGGVGLFYISFTCDPARREAATEAVQAALARRVRLGFTTAQLRKAIRQLVVGEINARKTVSGQAARLGLAEVVIGDLDHARAFFDRLRTVSSLELRRLLRTYLVPTRLTAVSLNPAAVRPAAAAPSARGGGGSGFPEFTDIRLANGARLLLQPDRRLPNLHLRLLALGGPVYETPSPHGASALMATLLTRDTRRRDAAAVARLIEEVGGVLQPFFGNNSLGLAVEVLPNDVQRGLGLLAEAACLPAFRPATFQREREALLAELAQDADDVVTFGQKLLRRTFFGAHPLALDARGDTEGVRGLRVADVAALHRRLLVSGNVVLAVAGDFSLRALQPALRDFLESLPAGTAEPVGPRSWTPPAAQTLEVFQPREQAVVFQAFPGPGLREADYYVGEVADELFSGMSSRLFERVREEKGLAYFVRSSRVTGLESGLFYFFAGTSPARHVEVLVEIEAEIARMADGGIEPEELRRAQTRLKAARRMSLQTNASRAMQAGLNALYGLPVEDWRNYDAHIEAVTRERLARLARERFRPDQRLQLVVRPPEAP